MKLIMPCETATKYLLPALRACIANNLEKKYRLNQVAIASILGVSQAAISKYLAGSDDKKIKRLIADKKIKRRASIIAKSIVDKKVSNEEIIDVMLKICDELVDDYPNLD